MRKLRTGWSCHAVFRLSYGMRLAMPGENVLREGIYWLEGSYRKFYERYELLIGSATAQQVLNKNDDLWRNFFRLLELKREGI
jgi:hypothetical protein